MGLWIEGAVIHQDLEADELRYRRFLTLGMDYTFGVGNGLHVLGEYFTVDRAADILDSEEGFSVTASSLNYPIGLIDQVTGIVYYHWDDDDWYHFVTWRRTYDRWSLDVSGFWNPEDTALHADSEGGGRRLLGSGLLVMVTVNH